MPLGRYSDDDTSPPSPGRPSAALCLPLPSSPARYPPLLTSNHPPPPHCYLPPSSASSSSSTSSSSLVRTPSAASTPGLVAPFPFPLSEVCEPAATSWLRLPTPCLPSFLVLSLYLSLNLSLSLSPFHSFSRLLLVLLNGENYQMRFPSGSKHASRDLIA